MASLGEAAQLLGAADEAREHRWEPTAQPTLPVRRRRPPSGQRQALLEDLLLDVAQQRRRVEAELVDEPSTRRCADGQRIGLTALAVEADHQVSDGHLAPRVGRDHRLQLDDRCIAIAVAHGQAETLLGGVQALLVETQRITLEPSDLGDQVAERPPAPELARRLVQREGVDRMIVGKLAGLGHEVLEYRDIHRVAGGDETVVGTGSRDVEGADAQQLAQVGDVHLQCSAGLGRPEPVGPQELDELVGGHGLADAERQLGQHGPLLRASQRHVTVDRSELHRAEQPQFDRRHGRELRSLSNPF